MYDFVKQKHPNVVCIHTKCVCVKLPNRLTSVFRLSSAPLCIEDEELIN